MWTTIVMVLFVILFFLLIGVIQQKEGFENPYAISQQHQGDIATFRKKINKLTISDELINTLQEKITILSDNTTKLQTNLPDKQAEQNAPI